MKISFRVSHHPEDEPAHRYRYTILHGKNKATSQGYKTHRACTHGVEGMWKGMAEAHGVLATDPVPYSKDSLLPRARRSS